MGLGWTHFTPAQTSRLGPAYLKKHKEEKGFVRPLISPTQLGRVEPVLAQPGWLGLV